MTAERTNRPNVPWMLGSSPSKSMTYIKPAECITLPVILRRAEGETGGTSKHRRCHWLLGGPVKPGHDKEESR